MVAVRETHVVGYGGKVLSKYYVMKDTHWRILWCDSIDNILNMHEDINSGYVGFCGIFAFPRVFLGSNRERERGGESWIMNNQKPKIIYVHRTTDALKLSAYA